MNYIDRCFPVTVNLDLNKRIFQSHDKQVCDSLSIDLCNIEIINLYYYGIMW